MARITKGEKRSPLRHQPLRTPGESLVEERDRILYDEVYPLLMLAGFMVVFAFIEWWTYFTKEPPHPWIATLVAVGFAAYAAYRLRKVRPRIRNLNLGLEGEKVVGQYLEAHRAPGWHVFHDICGPGFNVDHVIVSPKGVFAVETKTRSKPAKGKAVVAYDGTKVTVNGLEPDRDPVVQARAVRDWIRNLLFDTAAIKYPVRGVVLFPGWFVESPKGGARPEVWVLNEKAFVKYIENEPDVIRTEDVALAASRLANHIGQ